jgi:hypothetical protein
VLVLIAQLIYIIQKFRQQLAAIIDRLWTEFVVAKVQTIVGFHWCVYKKINKMIVISVWGGNQPFGTW